MTLSMRAARSDGKTIPPLARQNQFGLHGRGGHLHPPSSMSGRNKSFFFANYEGWRIRESTTPFGTVATTDEIAGRFNEPLAEPLGGTFPNSTIPSSRLSRGGGRAGIGKPRSEYEHSPRQLHIRRADAD